jgi:hypothetical protein
LAVDIGDLKTAQFREWGSLVAFLYERHSGFFSRPDSHIQQKHAVLGGQLQLVRVLARGRD